jgi:FtsH-binding integral membrane protein
MLVRITGVLALILGLLIWTENAGNLIMIHMLIGLVLVVSLLVLAALSTQAGVPIGLAAGVAVLALIALWLGMTQSSLLPGSSHWVIQILHLLVGMAAVGSGEAIGGRLRRMRLRPAT